MVMASRPARIRATPVLPLGSLASGLVLSATGTGAVLVVDVVSDIPGLAYPKFLGGAQAGHAVNDNGGQDQHADDGLLPELVDPQRGQGTGDGCEEQRAEGCSGHRSAAAEDRDTTDDGGGHHRQ